MKIKVKPQAALMKFYTLRNLIITFLILLVIILMVLLNTYSNFQSQRSELLKIQNSREALQKLEPALINFQQFSNNLNDLIVFGKNKYLIPYNEGEKKLQNDSLVLINLGSSDPENINKYFRLGALIHEMISFSTFIIHSHETKTFDTSGNNKWQQKSITGIVTEFKTIVDKLEEDYRKILTKSYGLSITLARKTFVFTGIISALMILALIISFLVSYRDIIERKKAEAQLKKFNEDLEKQVSEKTAGYFALVDTIDGIVWEADANTFQFSFVSKQAERLLGYPVEQWINEPTFWADHIHPDDKIWAVDYCIQNTLAKKPHEFEYRMITANGLTVWLRDIVTVIVENDKAVQLRGIMIDITGRKKTEEKVQKSEEKYRSMIEQASDGIFIADQDNFIIEANNSGCSMLGYIKEELRKMKFTELIANDDLKNNPVKFNELRSGNTTINERRLIRKDGSEISVEISSKLLSDGRYHSIIRDITERKKIENELRKSEEQYRSVIEQASDAIIITDQKGNIIDVNPSGCKQLGFTKEELTGLNIATVIDPEQLKTDPIRFDLLLSGHAISRERRAINKNGTIIEVETNVKMLPDGRILAIARDITERKKNQEELRKSEERYRSVIEQASDAIMITDQKGNFIDVNTSFCKQFGYTKEELMGLSIAEVIDPEQLKTDPVRFDLLLAGQFIFRERRMIHKNRAIIEVEANVKMLPDGRILAIARDITDRKRTEAKFFENKALLGLFVEHSPASLAMFDNNMRYILASRRWIIDYNLGDQLIIGKSHYEIFPNIPQKWKDIHQHCLAGAIEKNEEDLFIRIDGSIDWVRWEIHPWYKASGDVGGIIMFTEVITERKKAEDAIKESEERYKTLVENAPEALVVMDVEKNKFISVSQSAIKLFGMPKEELLKIGPLEVSPEYQPDGKLSSEAAIEKIKQAVAGKKPVFEWMHSDTSGKLMPCEVWLVRIPSEKNILIRGSIIDITERKKAQNELEQSYKSIRQLTEHLQNIREEERIAIAREIHDELGQQLTVLKMDISWLKKKLYKGDKDVDQKINGLLKMTDTTIKSIRKISSELRPSLLDDLGLAATMEWHLKEFENRSGIKTSFIAEDTERELSGTIKTTFFRIFQESLTNVARHAGATTVKVSLDFGNDNYILNITDDGKGFDKQKIAGKRTLGLLGMRERIAMTGGTYDIISTPGKGTKIIVTIPISKSN